MACGGVSPGRSAPTSPFPSPAPHPGLLKEPGVFQPGAALLEVAGNGVGGGLEVKHVGQRLDRQDVLVVWLLSLLLITVLVSC